ncbi:MAG: isochorismate lyase [Siphonobacter sp.]
MKTPQECQTMADIRREIDTIDQQVINLWAKRFEYVKAAAPFKTDAAAVKAPERLASMLQQRRVWAEEKGLSPDVIEGIYRDLVAYFIQEEMKHWQNQ